MRGYPFLLIFLLAFSLKGWAGEYHATRNETYSGATETLICSQCHTMHGTQGGQSMVYTGSGPYTKLLRASTVQNLCLYCHDGNNAGLSPPPPDVWGGTLAPGQSNPSAGNLCVSGGSPPCSDGSTNHTVGLTNVTPPGGTITFAEFTCVHCHNPHGNLSYRNLRSGGEVFDGVTFSNDIITYSMGTTEDGTKYVNNLVSPGLGVDKYETSVVVFKKVPTTDTGGIQGFCKVCHGDFHGAGGAVNMGGSTLGDTSTVGDEWKRHPTMDVTLSEGGTNLHADNTYWQSGPAWRPRVIDPDVPSAIDGDEMPFCLTCHRAHGSNRHSGLIFGDPSAGPGGGGTAMSDTCQRCHNQ